MRKNNIAVFMGEAKFKAKDTLSVTDKDGKIIELKAKNIIVATGASAAMLPGVTVDGKKIVTYVEAIMQETLPGSVVIVGGGSIGVEFAAIWNSYGVDVTIVEILPRILPREDEEVSKELTKELTKTGIKIKTNVKFESIVVSGAKVTVKLPGETLEVDQVLVATAFTPNSKGLGLEAVGVKGSPSLHQAPRASWLEAAAGRFTAVPAGNVSGIADGSGGLGISAGRIDSIRHPGGSGVALSGW